MCTYTLYIESHAILCTFKVRKLQKISKFRFLHNTMIYTYYCLQTERLKAQPQCFTINMSMKLWKCKFSSSSYDKFFLTIINNGSNVHVDNLF